MKYSMMTALSLVLGGGLVTAASAEPPDPYQQQNQQNQQQPKTQPQTQPQAQPQAAPQAQPQATPPAAPQGATDMNGNLTGKAAPPTGEKDVKDIAPVDLLFEFDSAALSPSSRADLEVLATFAKCQTKGAIILEGHADPRGTQAYNMQLSGARAAAVRQKLIAMGVPSDRIVVTFSARRERPEPADVRRGPPRDRPRRREPGAAARSHRREVAGTRGECDRAA